MKSLTKTSLALIVVAM